MKKTQKIKVIMSILLFILIVLIVPLSVQASNEGIEIVKKSDTDYLIYVKDNLNNDFTFAFSNDVNVNPETLVYTNAANDSANADANKIAYVNSSNISLFASDTYMWVKNSNNYIMEGIKVNLSDSITDTELEKANNISKAIKVDLTQVVETKEVVDDVEITKTFGKIVLLENGNYEYQLVKALTNNDYINFMKLAERISKINDLTSYYTKLEVYSDFYSVYKKIASTLVAESWAKVENNEIAQPEEALDGEEYVLWLRTLNNENAQSIDAQFLTCKKEISQEKIVEKVITKLPVTYDNNILLVVLGILVAITIFVTIRIAIIKKSEKK